MPGMGQGLLANNPIVVAAFQHALRLQVLVVGLLFLIIFGAWLARYVVTHPDVVDATPNLCTPTEPAGRRLLRIAFGLLWILDGALQAQSAMPLGMPTQVVTPAASTSPVWVQNLVAHGLTTWLRHPIPAATSAVWIQVGIGVLLIVAPRGLWSRSAGAASAGWALIVWVFGEAFGGVFAPGASVLFGAPGAVLVYALAGALIALPERSWSGGRLGRWILGGTGLFFVGMAVLQAWPGRGFWQGQATTQATPGNLTAMAQSMSQTPQPHVIAHAVSWFAKMDAQHGWAINLVVVGTLLSLGVGLVVVAFRWRPGMARVVVGLTALACLADWILVQDMGFFGGVGTDPNSMLPIIFLVASGYLACVRPLVAPAQNQEPSDAPPRSVALLNALIVVGALGVILFGAAPMAVAGINTHTDPILTEALNGDPGQTNQPAANFNLTDQVGRHVSLASLRGRAVALTFLDPVCTSDCPLIAQQFRVADQMLDPKSRKHTVFVAIVANPIYRAPEFVTAFNKQERLNGIPNWLFLTGSLPALQQTWAAYGYQVQTLSAGAMVAHTELAYIIDPSGRLRARIGSNPGADVQTAASLSTLLAQQMRAVLPQ